MLLDALPRTADGAPDPARLPGLPSAPAPEGARAQAVTEGFTELLGRQPGPDDDFFLLGGHSLVAVQLAERLRQALKLPLTGLDIMQARTPRAVTALLDARAAERAAAPTVTAARPRQLARGHGPGHRRHRRRRRLRAARTGRTGPPGAGPGPPRIRASGRR
ncbi:phosphopantetheine-binding protein [Streptomyces sp. RPA4-5]|uniref:phosphopantetheine-binding protein n=1 Tax=Streptomyces sp. RPA4-5 TaxID=2721245 RepID=UPI002001E01A|nr:phosphopantetheine-binding protein [Streptomyces sp. RPA4-5]